MANKDKFLWQGNDLIVSQCLWCKHKHAVMDKASCDAFPEGIPAEIMLNVFVHNKKHPKQKNDVLFERDKPDGE
jgi:hypothetical protein